MFSFRGLGFKIGMGIVAVLILVVGCIFIFTQPTNYEKTNAVIVSIEEDPNYIPDPDSTNDKQYIVKVKYSVEGKEYTSDYGFYSPSYKVGDTVEIQYDPKDPSKTASPQGPIFGYIAIAVGGGLLVLLIVGTILTKKKVKKIEEVQGENVYAPSEKGDERELYFLTDLGTPKAGHRIEDRNRKVLYEAKIKKFAMAKAFEVEFIDHVHNKTTLHLVGQREESDRNSIILDDHHTFDFDGVPIWKHLKRSGVTVESRLASGKVLTPSYTVFRDGEEIAYIEQTSQYVHEDDAEKHKIANKMPIEGFYRIFTREKNLDLLFVTIMAFARSGATDASGGGRKILFNSAD